MINRKNYEIWFLDYFEGNLSEEDIRILFDFLDKNPELKEEFDDFELIILDTEETTFGKKEDLKRELDINTIADLDKFETLAVKDLEGEITDSEKSELNSIIKFSEEKNKEYTVFRHTVLKPDKQLIFENKEKLKKSPGIIIPLWVKYISSAAAILLLVLFVRNINTNEPNNIVNDNNIVENTKKEIKNTIQTTESQTGKEEIPVQIAQNNKSVPKQLKTSKYYKKHNKTGVKAEKESKNRQNNIQSIAHNAVEIALPETGLFNNIEKINISLKPVDLIERDRQKTLISQDKPSIVKALTPKEFLIKTVKNKLDIDDKDYDKLDPVELASASLEKLSIAQVDYRIEPKTKQKHFSLNIRGFGIERTWAAN